MKVESKDKQGFHLNTGINNEGESMDKQGSHLNTGINNEGREYGQTRVSPQYWD